MSELDDPQDGDLGAVVISFVVLLASILITFVVYYVLVGFS